MTAALIDYAFARRFGVVATECGDHLVSVALRAGDDPRALVEVRRVAGRPLAITTVDAPAFDRLLAQSYAIDGAAAAGALDTMGEQAIASEDLLDPTDDAPVIRLLNGLIAEAVRRGVSDIHLDPREQALVVRMRIDGELVETARLPAAAAAAVVSRVKVMARLDIAERRLPQDGRIGLTLGGKSLDVRVATLPARGGERVTLRLLDPDAVGFDLGDLGMTAGTEAAFRTALGHANGIVLVTGPTGAGKTTTLYAALRLLGRAPRNILTVEDPVEYAIDGISQTQVNPRIGLDFAAGLRAILRQDPDIVMVGEIRDRETAEVAVQAALTGHLVLSSVHANSAAGAITRLRDFGVEPYLLAAALRAVVGQRLLRRVCPACHGPGCAACDVTGFSGRVGAFEVLQNDAAIRPLIHDGADEALIARTAFAATPTLASELRRLADAGVVVREEAARALGEVALA